MRVSAQISEDIFRAAERLFAVDDPFVAEHVTDKGVKSLRIRKMPQLAMEADFVFGESVLQGFLEFPPKNSRENLLRQKEAMA